MSSLVSIPDFPNILRRASGSRSSFSETAFLHSDVFVALTKTFCSSVSFPHLASTPVCETFFQSFSNPAFHFFTPPAFALISLVFPPVLILFHLSRHTSGDFCLVHTSHFDSFSCFFLFLSGVESIHEGPCTNAVEGKELQKKRIIRQIDREKTSPEATQPQREDEMRTV